MAQKILFMLLLVFVFFSTEAQRKFGNEWISDDQDLYKITIAEKGIYRISYEDLKRIAFPVDVVDVKRIQLFHHGREVPVWIAGEADGVFNAQDYIEFYGEGNNGEQDSLLYRPESSRMNVYQSLYSDKTAYFLTLGNSPLRTKELKNLSFKSSIIELFHTEQQIKAFNEQYSFNNSIGFPPFVMQSYFEQGEGWTSKIIVGDSLAKFPIQLINYLPQNDKLPILECLFNGRTETVHDVNIGLQNNQGQARNIGKIDYFGFAPLKIITEIATNEISGDGQILLKSQSNKKDKIEWYSITYHKVSYPQSFEMSNLKSKLFYLRSYSTTERHVSVLNAPADAQVYELFDRYNFRKINSFVEGRNLNFVTENSFSSKAVLVSSEIKKPIDIQKVSVNLDYKKTSDFLIITHSSLLESAREFANYRASTAGGAFKTNLIDIQDLYLRFSFGERTPLAIRRFVDFQLSKGQKISYLFLVGRGKSFPDALKTDAALDLVPTMGYPGSDVLLTAGLDGFDLDVQAVATGRLNVVSNQEVLNYLQKVKEYESNTEDLLWKKDVLHLSGGGSKSEISYFKDILKGIEPKIYNGYMAGNVGVFSKKTDNNIENVDISEAVNKGVGLITFFGHSSSTATDLNIGYASNPNGKLQNKGKYPLMYFNGCGVGNVFNRYDLLTTDWLITPNKGAIAVFANSFWSYDFPTNRYINNLYEKLFEDTQTLGESIGKIQQAVNIKLKSEGADLLMLSNIHQLILQGDPAIKVFSLKKPDYNIEKIFLKSKNQSSSIAQNDSVLVGVIASNFGKYQKNGSINVSVKSRGPSKNEDRNFRINSIAYRDTAYFAIKKDQSQQSIVVRLDFDNQVEENNEQNNEKELTVDWSAANPYSIYPSDAIPDELNPILAVYFDDKKLRESDYVAANATLRMLLTDDNPISSKDTSVIALFIQSCETCKYQQIPSKYVDFVQKSPNTVEANYNLPNLSKGKYKLLVVGHDAKQNSAGNGYNITFLVSEEFLPSTLSVYPNPADDFCNLEFKIINKSNPKSGVARLYDIHAKLVDEVIFSPKVGKNEVFFNWKGQFSAGLYTYKAVIEWPDDRLEEFDGKIIVK
ncbi:hypothetical protein EGI26_06230 [Lacihabitans sp. CCS-44]|uniref:putative type IX secretion system sortase PorU2 n=1 Tax=Lacihabitans sp. CCS-44 TaxID=2487331 RepID=UPI0020CD781A|nr:C25 family cysteine peptidase [Lacihabitans sp. CCS-44]MCP9754759.1 hypothetical protein [Lacihabitans sp. CCS-44]